jgi:HK97 family phage major capsid protein
MTLEEMRARLKAIAEERATLHKEAGENPFDEAQQQIWDEMDAEEERLAPMIKETEATELRQKRVAESRARWQSTKTGIKQDPFDSDVRTLGAQATLSRSMSVLDSPDGGRHLDARQKAKVEKLLRTVSPDMDGQTFGQYMLATENPAYRSAFQKASITAHPTFTMEEQRALEQVKLLGRAMSIGTPSAGGYAVPILIDPTVILTAQGSDNPILEKARVDTITNDTWRGLTSAGVTWSFDAEATEVSDDSPTVAQPEIDTRKAQGFIPFSIEVGMDWPGFAESMSEMLREGYNELLAEKLTTGTGGSNEPAGLVTSLAAEFAIARREVAVAGTIGTQDIYDLWDALPQRFRRQSAGPQGGWMSSTNVQNSIRQLGTLDPNFTIDMTEESIPRLFGRSYALNDYMADDPTGTGTQVLLVVGDFRNYLVAQRVGMTVELVPHLFGATGRRPTGQRGWYAYARVGAGLLVPNAFRYLSNRSA